MIAPNTVLGNRYKVTRPLGGGGMKQVYLAADTRLANRPCALAEMIDSFADPRDRQTAAAAFHREADMLAGLAHDRIVQIYDKFSEGNRHFLVMEYVEGETLEEKLRAAGAGLDESTTIDIALQVLDAIEYLHSRTPPVIYRDLKPSNVIVSPDGRAKLVDFGIARFFQPQATATMVGTQGYAPPEQYKGKVEARTDLYALGATMHFMLTGRDPALEPPFMFPPVQELCPGCSPTLADLVTEALALDLKDRVPSAADFKRRLTRLKNPTATSIAAPRNPRQAASSAPTVAALDAALCANCAKPIPTDARFCPYCSSDLAPAPQPAPPVRAGIATRVTLWAVSILALFAVAFAGVYYYQQNQREQQRIAAAREHPLVFKQLTLALSTRTGEAIAPPATSFKDTEITNNKYLKWSATFDNAIAGLGSADEKVEARFIDSNGKQVAASVAERLIGSTDKEATFSSVVLMPEGGKTTGNYRVGLYFGDQKLGEAQFTITEDIAAKRRAAGGSEDGSLSPGHPTIELPTEARAFVNKIERAAIANPKDVTAWNKFGAVAMRAAMFDQNYYGKAEEAYGHVLKLEPDNLDALRGIGDIDYDKEHYDEAIAAYEHYLKKKPDDPEVRTDLGTMYLYTGNADQAVVQYKKAVVSKPGFFQAYYNMGIAYAQMNKPDDAAATLKRAFALAPDDASRTQVKELLAKLSGAP